MDENAATLPEQQQDPAAPVVSASAGNLPAEVTRFVGRRFELSQARERFARTRLLTLTGTAGVGKTRLALRVAGEMKRSFRDGVWLVELADLQDPSLLGHTVGMALGLREESAHGRITTLTEHFAAKQLLLVLDNCEHIIDACAELVNALLRACPHLHVLATSRQSLGISGESVLPVPSLSIPDPDHVTTVQGLEQYEAVALFLDRATSVDPGFRVTDDNHRALARLCAVLDGIPLALELAAVRLPSLSLNQVLERMDDPYRLLTGGSRSAPARQQTLRASIDWTFDLCAPKERMLWARLSVFAGSFELDAAEGVCCGDGLEREDILDLLRSLVDKSILTKQERLGTRYYILETIRQYGEERLSGDDAVGWRRRHRDWYQELVARAESEWMGPAQAEIITRLRQEHANIRNALDFCVSAPAEAPTGMRMVCALDQYWWTRGLMGEGRLWLDRLLASETAPTLDRAHALRLKAALAILQGDYDIAEVLLDEAHPIARSTGDPAVLALLTMTSGSLAMFRGDLARSMKVFERALEKLRAVGHRIGEVQTLYLGALAAVLAGETERAAAWNRECQRVTISLGENWFRSRSLWAMGLDAWRQGDSQRAYAVEHESLQMKRALDDRLGIAMSLEALAWIAASDKEAERAAVLFGAADTIWRMIGSALTASPLLKSYRDEGESRVREALKDRAFEAAYSRGAGLEVDQAITYALREAPRPELVPGPHGDMKLTRREREVSELVADGLSNRDIAERLVISQRTAEAHVEHILTKCNFSSRTQIAALVAEQRARRRLPGR